MTTSIPLHVIRFASALFGSPKQIHSIKMQRVLSSPFYYIIGDIEIRLTVVRRSNEKQLQILAEGCRQSFERLQRRIAFAVFQ